MRAAHGQLTQSQRVSMAKVIIVGGSGFIGGRLAEILRLRGVEVITTTSLQYNFLDEDDARLAMSKCDHETTVVMCAGISRLVEESWRTYHMNVLLARNLMRGLANHPPRNLIFLSSTDVYGLPVAVLPISESTLPNPSTFYGLSKLASETLMTLNRQPKWPVTRLRLPGIYGFGDGQRSVVGRLCGNVASGQPVRITGNGTVARDFVHVDDLCRLIEQLVIEPVDDTFNVVTGNSFPLNQIAELVGKELGVRPIIERIAGDSNRDHDLSFQPDRLRASFPAIEFRGLEQGIRDYVAAMLPAAA